jgi:hypothetical protein
MFTIIEKKSKLANAVDGTKERIQLRKKKEEVTPTSFAMTDLISGNQVERTLPPATYPV